jgi:nucleoside-diphosphate-sugar epimerase
MSAPAPTTVCVTGATGFIALHIVRRLLDAGHTVHATVRQTVRRRKQRCARAPRALGARAVTRPCLQTGQSAAQLRGLDASGQKLKLFEADLLRAGSFDAAVSGCVAVIHTVRARSQAAGRGLRCRERAGRFS